MASESETLKTMASQCERNMKEGIMDGTYLEHRLDALGIQIEILITNSGRTIRHLHEIEGRIDDLCGLLGEVLERIDKGQTVSEVTITVPPSKAEWLDAARRWGTLDG